MKKIYFSVFMIALTTLMVELALVRIFDVIWYANKAYMIITMVMFCFGLAGVYQSLRPMKQDGKIGRKLWLLTFLFGAFILLIMPLVNWLPLDFHDIQIGSGKDTGLIFLLYFFIAVPFFLSGMLFAAIFSCYAKQIQRLYFWDLFGAAIGCLILIPFLPHIGPAGTLILGGGFCWITAGILAKKRAVKMVVLTLGIIVVIIPFYKSFSSDTYEGRYFEFKHHISKRSVQEWIKNGGLESSYWDPISKIDILAARGGIKHIAYDGGSQSSWLYPFDGDFKKLKASLPGATKRHFGSQNVYLSHYLKQDTEQEVLIIGSAAGQETKAALTYGAKRVDAVEMVGFVMKVGKETYNKLNGNIFNHPNVRTHVDEGRSFLRASKKKYDIIQIYSNHTSSSIAAGSGAMATTYLQTEEAYTEYFQHLKEDGLLQINHHVYPRMVTTAAKAWKKLGYSDFRRYVLVFMKKGKVQDNLPTLLIRMTPWTKEEVNELEHWFIGNTALVEHPYNNGESMLSDEFYSGELSKETTDLVPFRVTATTDNHPYFNFLRKKWEVYSQAYPDKYMDYSTAALLSSQYKGRAIPNDIEHIVVVSIASLFFAFVFIIIPLLFSKAGRIHWSGKVAAMGYFACLGAGFIIVELVFIQIFMKLIGFPLHTYSSVVFSLLIAAALGSIASDKMQITPKKKWLLPFVGTILSLLLFISLYSKYFQFFLAFSIWLRILAAIIFILPSGFFMGMCFPLGILAINKQPQGAIAWAWGMNGLFTVIGSIASVLLSIFYGFNLTLLFGISFYVLALFLFKRIPVQEG